MFYNWKNQDLRLFSYLLDLVFICWNGACCTVCDAHNGFLGRRGTHGSAYTFIVIVRFPGIIWERKRENDCLSIHEEKCRLSFTKKRKKRREKDTESRL
jgi:hypothetical protein